MFKTILDRLLPAVFYLVVYKFLLFISSNLFASSFASFSLFFGLPIEVILSVILFPIKSHVTSVVFRTTFLEAVFAELFPVFVAVFISFLPYLYPNFLANDKKPFLYFGLSDISYILSCSNYDCNVHIIFYF